MVDVVRTRDMNYLTKIINVATVDEIEGAWTSDDYIKLLEAFDFPDADALKAEELRGMLFLAMSDFEPPEAAKVLLNYRLADQLNEGQMDQLAHEMLNDKVSEEYPDIALHHALFDVNQLLYKAYNGKFPCAHASVITFEMTPNTPPVTKEIVLKAFAGHLAGSNVIKRLFAPQLSGDEPFGETENVVWELRPQDDGSYELITSTYWLDGDDFTDETFEAVVADHVPDHG